MEQISIFDWMPSLIPEPNPGDWVEDHGELICRGQIESFLGKKIVMDCSTQSHEWYKVGIVEKILPAIYYHNGVETETVRVIVDDGKRTRCYITYIPGEERIYELAERREKC